MDIDLIKNIKNDFDNQKNNQCIHKKIKNKCDICKKK